MLVIFYKIFEASFLPTRCYFDRISFRIHKFYLEKVRIVLGVGAFRLQFVDKISLTLHLDVYVELGSLSFLGSVP